MRTQTEVDGEGVLAVYVKKACEHLNVSPAAFTFAVRKSGIGRTQIKRHFIKEGSGSVIVKQGSDDCTNRSCCAVFLKDLPDNIRCQLRECELPLVSFIQVHFSFDFANN